MPTGTVRQIGYANRDNVAKNLAGITVGTWTTIRNTADSASLSLTTTSLETSMYIDISVVGWGTAGYKYIRPTVDGVSPSSAAVSYLSDQVSNSSTTFVVTGLSLGSHTIGAQIMSPDTGSISYRTVTIKVYEVKS